MKILKCSANLALKREQKVISLANRCTIDSVVNVEREKFRHSLCGGLCCHSIMLCYLYCYQALCVDSAAFFSRQRRKQKTTKWTVVKRGGLGVVSGGRASCGLAQTTFLPAWKLLFPRSNTCRCNLTPSLPPTSFPPHGTPLELAVREPVHRVSSQRDATMWKTQENDGAREGETGGKRASLNWSWPVAASHFDAFSSRELNLVYRKMQRRKEQVEEAETVVGRGKK